MKQVKVGRGGLAVRRETVRVLIDEALRGVVGGAGAGVSDGLQCPDPEDDQRRHWQSATCGTQLQPIIEPEPRQGPIGP